MARLVERSIGPRSDVAVLPVASVENHGVLPLGTDYLIAECVMKRLEEKEPRGIITAPIVPYSTAMEHFGVGFTVSVRPTVFIEYLVDVLKGVSTIARSIIVAVFHGGAYNASFLAGRLARRELQGVRIAVYNFWDTAARVVAGEGVRQYPIHADPLEASVLYACGYKVNIEEASRDEVISMLKERSRQLRGKLVAPWLGEDAQDLLYPTQPVKASRELGEKILEESVEDLLALINVVRGA